MKKIKLTKGQVTLVDDEDFKWLNKTRWYARWSKSEKVFYAVSAQGKLLIHREIMKTPKGLVVDHINHDTLDNRKENLRNVTQRQNTMNSKPRKNNKVGLKGVFIDRGRFRAQITLSGKNVYLGWYKTKEEAAQARKKAENKHFGIYNYKE